MKKNNLNKSGVSATSGILYNSNTDAKYYQDGKLNTLGSQNNLMNNTVIINSGATAQNFAHGRPISRDVKLRS